VDLQQTDSYFVVAHFHYVVFGTVVFAMFAGFYFWWPKFTGRMLDETLGKIHFWMLFIGFHTTFLIQHWLGVIGMPRRYADYMPEEGFTWMNQVSSVGAFILGASMLPFAWNVYTTWRRAPLVTVDDPWGFGRSLEWATSCPPPRHNFTSLPRIRSESPAFDLHHPEVAAMEHPELYPGVLDQVYGDADRRGQRELGQERAGQEYPERRQTSTLVLDEPENDEETGK
jgi:cytochrome c oxidase subunit 1